ncbi:NADH:ubiquinone reductase (Na(+)-transporting) subunit C [Sediminitomix flava]|uniref:Na(+)-translocating NADH-quinone reductase subunit C n=1 Tax=Sediminitomix flava TaxID=379075 RepID=A0A315ZBV0_SEDFL|nr:NADH:ubiquinone reductase (Na(+)-transporting) subunit C [Sediminitomix flava]PWJ42840.1 Na+-transporting NADH:ubiquinone oxidoreductase subunit C [Sediminitomix flava]
MQQSNGYVIGFAVAMTVIIGGLLATVKVVLKERQDTEIALDTKKQILQAVGVTGDDKQALAAIYKERIQSVVVNAQGEQVSDFGAKSPEDVSVQANWKVMKKQVAALKGGDKKASIDYTSVNDVNLPIFKFMKEGSKTEVEAYILPVYGYGLWNDIWGYVAMNPDMKTIKGAVFGHAGETPGLGARMSDADVQDRYQGKSIVENGKISPVLMMKGEGNTGISDNEVDGMSGATLTRDGLNEMMVNYLNLYEPYMQKIRGNAVSLR